MRKLLKFQKFTPLFKSKNFYSKMAEGLQFYQKGTHAFQEQNFEKAKEYFTKAVELGNLTAVNNLAVMYTEGIGVPKDIKKAIELYEHGINSQDPNSYYNLARIYQIQGEYEKALELLEKTVDKGHSYASSHVSLGWLVLELKNDVEGAKKLYQMGIDAGNETAFTYMGDLYLHHLRDEEIAKRYYEEAASKDEKRALTILATMSIAEGDVNKGIEALEAAKELNYTPAMNQLGVLYVNGYKDLIQVDYEKAKENFQTSINFGDPIGHLNMAFLYLNGLGVEKDENIAVEHLQQSYQKGGDEAKEILQKMGKL